VENNDDYGTTSSSIVPTPNNIPYIVAVVTMMLIGVVAIVVLVVMRPDNKDNLLIIGLIVGFLAPTTLSLLAFMKSQETHLSVNSRLDAFMKNARMAAHAQGVTEGRTEGRVSADARTDALATANSTPATPAIPTQFEASVFINPPKS